MYLLFNSPLFLTVEAIFKIPSDRLDAFGNADTYQEIGYLFSLKRALRPQLTTEWGQTEGSVIYTAYTKERLDPAITVGAIGDGVLQGRPITLRIIGINPPGTIFVSNFLGDTLQVEIQERSLSR